MNAEELGGLDQKLDRIIELLEEMNVLRDLLPLHGDIRQELMISNKTAEITNNLLTQILDKDNDNRD